MLWLKANRSELRYRMTQWNFASKKWNACDIESQWSISSPLASSCRKKARPKLRHNSSTVNACQTWQIQAFWYIYEILPNNQSDWLFSDAFSWRWWAFMQIWARDGFVFFVEEKMKYFVDVIKLSLLFSGIFFSAHFFRQLNVAVFLTEQFTTRSDKIKVLQNYGKMKKIGLWH